MHEHRAARGDVIDPAAGRPAPTSASCLPSTYNRSIASLHSGRTSWDLLAKTSTTSDNPASRSPRSKRSRVPPARTSSSRSTDRPPRPGSPDQPRMGEHEGAPALVAADLDDRACRSERRGGPVEEPRLLRGQPARTRSATAQMSSNARAVIGRQRRRSRGAGTATPSMARDQSDARTLRRGLPARPDRGSRTHGCAALDRRLESLFTGDPADGQPVDPRMDHVAATVSGFTTPAELAVLKAAVDAPSRTARRIWRSVRSRAGRSAARSSTVVTDGGRRRELPGVRDGGAGGRRELLTTWRADLRRLLASGSSRATATSSLTDPDVVGEPVGVYFFDGAHTWLAHYLALGVVEHLLADEALVLVDDATWPVVRRATMALRAPHRAGTSCGPSTPSRTTTRAGRTACFSWHTVDQPLDARDPSGREVTPGGPAPRARPGLRPGLAGRAAFEGPHLAWARSSSVGARTVCRNPDPDGPEAASLTPPTATAATATARVTDTTPRTVSGGVLPA